MLQRRETCLNLQGCPKVPHRSQPLVGRSSPYYKDMWRRYCCLTSLFQLSIYTSVVKIQPDKVVRWCLWPPAWKQSGPILVEREGTEKVIK